MEMRFPDGSVVWSDEFAIRTLAILATALYGGDHMQLARDMAAGLDEYGHVIAGGLLAPPQNP